MAALLMMILAAALASSASDVAVPDAALEAMRKLPALEGRWSGEGWIRTGPGEPTKFVGEEVVESRLDRRVLIIEGRHHLPDRSRMVHHALAVVTWDDAAKEYRFRSQVVGGGAGDHRGYMKDGAFVWENASKSGLIRFEIRVDGDTWHEVGHIERGGRWYPMFEMTLHRVKQ